MIALLEDPTEHSFVKQVVAGAKHILAKPTSKKEPVTILRMLVDRFGGDDAPLSDMCTLAICLLSFAGFLRFDEIANQMFCFLQIMLNSILSLVRWINTETGLG